MWLAWEEELLNVVVGMGVEAGLDASFACALVEVVMVVHGPIVVEVEEAALVALEWGQLFDAVVE